MPIKVKEIDNIDDFLQIESDWRAVLDKSSSNTIFLTWEWITSWWNCYGKGKKLLVLKIMDKNSVIGFAPFYSTNTRPFFLNYVSLRLVGDGSFDSDYLDFISVPGEESIVVRAALDYLFEKEVNWRLLFFSEVPKQSKHLSSLREYLNVKKVFVRETETGCPYIPLPDSWEDYLQGLKPRMRTKVRSLIRKLEEKHKVEFELCTSQSALKSRLKSLYDLHQKRWQIKDREGVFLSPEKQAFYREMSEKFLNNGWLRLYSLKIDNRYVAHQFCFEYRDTVYLLQEGFDPEWFEHGVGNVLRAKVINDSIGKKVKVYDFLAGETRHKMSWGVRINTNVSLVVGKINFKNFIYFNIPLYLRMVKHWLLKILNRR